jgi:membrane protease YdiL (CAAX protease family)
MQQQPNTYSSMLLITTTLLSVAALYYLWQKHAGGQHLLAYEPRRRVPWNLLAALLAIMLPAGLVLLLSDNDVADMQHIAAADFIYLGWIQSMAKLSVVLLGLGCLAAFLRADSKDLGLPQNLPQAVKDCRLGIFACVASMLPIYSIQILLSRTFDSQQQHELIDQMQETYSLQMVLVALVLAVVVAPIYEEFAFRLLFQGWLEKFEDKLVGYFATERQDISPGAEPEIARPAHGMIPELPHGWAPVLVSGLLFGLAHLGQNIAAPVSLTLFGIVLGYLYQRTHRLLPCIAAHMAFNAFSLLLLLLQLGKPSV